LPQQQKNVLTTSLLPDRLEKRAASERVVADRVDAAGLDEFAQLHDFVLGQVVLGMAEDCGVTLERDADERTAREATGDDDSWSPRK